MGASSSGKSGSCMLPIFTKLKETPSFYRREEFANLQPKNGKNE